MEPLWEAERTASGINRNDAQHRAIEGCDQEDHNHKMRKWSQAWQAFFFKKFGDQVSVALAMA